LPGRLQLETSHRYRKPEDDSDDDCDTDYGKLQEKR